MKVPRHVAIIPDGNRRWARERGLPIFEGHRRGFDLAVKLARQARQMGIYCLTLWGFSTENWQRSKKEVNYLMRLYGVMIDKFLPDARKDKVKIIHLGRKDRLPKALVKKIKEAQEATENNQKYILCIALDYGGRDEILRAIQKMLTIHHKPFAIRQLNEAYFAQFLDTAGLPDPDLIIRTSGEQRLSGFLPWQTVYAELYFPSCHFPDFTPDKFTKAIEEYSRRQRRYGK